MNSKDYQILIDKLEMEIKRNETVESWSGDIKNKEVAKEYIKYHKEMIHYIKRIDEGLEL